MARGDAGVQEGDHTKARDAWRAAAKDYPTAKQPWLKLSEDYFNAADYGNAVLAAQEALQRDPHDRLANSVLAVSGLRLTAGSLAALRDDGAYAVGSRDEAVAVTHSLREALGEPVLVPTPENASQHRRLAKAPRPTTGASGVAGATPVATAPPVPPPRTAAATPPAGNPLDKLK
jgi:tetratricopeptide (TPR) repeat protein